ALGRCRHITRVTRPADVREHSRCDTDRRHGSGPAEAPNESPDAAPAAARVAVHAVALRALLSEAPNVLPPCRATAPQGLARPTGGLQRAHLDRELVRDQA